MDEANRPLGLARKMAELIYRGIGDEQPNLRNGRPFDYNKAVQSEHRTHVHFRSDGS